MSCIAVHIHEVKEKTLRIELSEPLYGKDGDKQQGKYQNADTMEPVTKFAVAEKGFYEVIEVFGGKCVSPLEKICEGEGVAGTLRWTLINAEKAVDNDSLYYSKTLYMVRTTGDAFLCPFIGFTPASRLDYWYMSIRRLPG